MNLNYLLTRTLSSACIFGALVALPMAKGIVIYGNGATYGTDDTYVWNVDVGAGTSTLTRTYTDVGLQPNGNGRGMVVVGNIMYTTDSGSGFEGDNHIYMTDVTSGARLGSFTTTIPGTVNLSTLAWDGKEFWSSQYIGGGNAYRFGLDGVVTSTIALGAYDSKDGMEWFNGKLIANRGDTVGPYDVYDLSGGLLTAGFLNGVSDFHGSTNTGIAFDGTYFFTVSNFNSLNVWDGVTGAYVKNIALDGSFNSIEDISVDYNDRVDTHAPDGGATLGLLGLAMIGLVALRRKFGQA